MIREFNRYFKKEECEEVFGEKNGRFFVSWIARNKLIGFTVMANIDVNDDKYNEALLALTFDADCGLEDRCHIAIKDDYADAIIAKAKKLIAKKN